MPGQEPFSLKQYESAGGYQGIRAALKMTPQEVQEVVASSALRGRGGAGFPTGMKWKAVPMGADAPRQRFYIMNADEMEPGTMKDRLLLEGDPHQAIEGMIIGAYAIGADQAIIFLRWAYKEAARRLLRAMDEARKQGYLGRGILGSDFNLELSLHISSGRYMCGEETALINALEGKRPNPRSKPPFPQLMGLWGKPTVVNNAETICNLPHIMSKGAEWFKGLSLTADGGTKIYGVSGRVQQPGLWELPLGVTAREILEVHAGGMCEGYRLRGVQPGGASTAFLTPDQLDARMDFGELEKVGNRLGTGTMIVLDDCICPVGVLVSLESFFARESCGWCTPCREGLPWVIATLLAVEEGDGTPVDLEVLDHHVHSIRMGHTFCALAPGAMAPLESLVTHFRPDIERHITEHRCPWRK